jgi:hypothetical protein
MKQHGGARISLHIAFTLAAAIVVALYAVGTMRAATTNRGPTVTTKVMVAGLEAIHYPIAHPKKLTCRGLGASVKGGHRSFKCVAILKEHRERRFYAQPVAKGGWLCAGKALSSCVTLKRGFFPAPAADNQGWQEIAVLGWLQAHHIDANGRVSLSCTGVRSPMTCTLNKRPTVAVVLTYQKAGAGYVESATRR